MNSVFTITFIYSLLSTYNFDIKTKLSNNHEKKTDEKPPFYPIVKNHPITDTVWWSIRS